MRLRSQASTGKGGIQSYKVRADRGYLISDSKNTEGVPRLFLGGWGVTLTTHAHLAPSTPPLDLRDLL
jgi:hypothetical protein